jgi:hypothetical protein
MHRTTKSQQCTEASRFRSLLASVYKWLWCRRWRWFLFLFWLLLLLLWHEILNRLVKKTKSTSENDFLFATRRVVVVVVDDFRFLFKEGMGGMRDDCLCYTFVYFHGLWFLFSVFRLQFCVAWRG